MTRRSKIWLVVAVLFTVINAIGAVPAFLAGELSHAGVHVVLTFVGAYYVRRIWSREVSGVPTLAGEVGGGEFSNRLTNLEQSIDAVAIEVERIGEGQRFITNFFTEKGIPRPAEGAADPIEVKDATPKTR
jgi:hypothetical protein